MKLPYEFFISLRYLRSKRKQPFISIITLISLGGITLGVASLIIVLSVMNGFQKDLKEKILGIKSHVVIYERAGTSMENYDKEIESIKDIKGIISSTPFILNQAMIKVRNNTEGAVIWGIDPIKQNQISGVSTEVLINKEGEKPGILLGKELSSKLLVSKGDEVILITPIFKATPLGLIPKVGKFVVAGTFKSGMYEYDSTFGCISLKDAQILYEIGDKVTGIEVRVDDIYKVKEIGKIIKNKISVNLSVYDWMQMNRNLFSALKLEKIVMTIMLTLIILVAVFNVLSSLIMMVMKKTKEIGVLRSIGVPQKGIMKIFIYNGVIIGVIGTILGLILGTGTSLLLKKYQFIKLPGDVYYIDYLPVELRIEDIIIVIGVSILLSFLSTIYPAYRASKLDPVEAIRYE
ncbi:MAG: lipoprotein-releasing ABC transporter permease subunit [Candidatus Firestonebacteria bacterium]